MEDKEIISWALIHTSADPSMTAREVMEKALPEGLSIRDVDYTVATGYGRLIVPFANRMITEISCHAKGTHFLFPKARTILDMGGQDCKAIKCDGEGKVINFAMNDRCAAGTGRFLERMGKVLEVPLQEIGPLSLEIKKEEVIINQTCTVYAQSDVIRLLRQGRHRNDILAGVCKALTGRILSLLNTIKVEREFSISGGIAKNIGIVSRLEEQLSIKAQIAFEPQIVGAIGAAIFAREFSQREGNRKLAEASKKGGENG